MKQYIILFGTIFLVIALHIFQSHYFKKTSRYIFTDLNDIENAINRNDFERAKLSFKELQSTWKNVKCGWDSFAEHDDIGQIENNIYNLEIYIKQMESTDSIIGISNIRHLLDHVMETEKLKINNIL